MKTGVKVSLHKGIVSVFSSHKKARKALRENGMAFVTFVLSLFSFFAFCGGAAFFEVIFHTLASVTPMSDGVAYGLAALCSVCLFAFLIAPLWRGVQAFLLGYILHSRIEYGAIFSFYTAKGRYCYAVRAALSLISRIVLFFGALYLILRVGRTLALDLLRANDTVRATLVLSLTLLFSLVLLLLLWVLSAQRYAMDATLLSAPLLSYRQIKTVSKYAVRGQLGVIFRHQLMLFPYILLSLLCFGVPLLFVVPYALMAKNILATEFLRK